MKKAFTLAEVLITLAIIGIVAAMTLPSLTAKYQQKEFTAGLKKFYSQLSQALLKLQADNEELTYEHSTGMKLIEDNFKIIKKCSDGALYPCVSETYTKLSGRNVSLNKVNASPSSRQCYIIASGAGVCVFDSLENTSVTTQIAFDVNGIKKPNVAGRDMFLMYIYKNRKIDDLKTISAEDDNESSGDWRGVNKPPTSEEREEMFNKQCFSNSAGFHGCFGKILNDGWEMNY